MYSPLRYTVWLYHILDCIMCVGLSFFLFCLCSISHSMLYTYIWIYVCVCVCKCMYVRCTFSERLIQVVRRAIVYTNWATDVIKGVLFFIHVWESTIFIHIHKICCSLFAAWSCSLSFFRYSLYLSFFLSLSHSPSLVLLVCRL